MSLTNIPVGLVSGLSANRVHYEKVRLQEQINLFVSQGQYLEWSISELQSRFGRVPNSIKFNSAVPSEYRLLATAELYLRSPSTLKAMVAEMKQTSHNVTYLIEIGNLMGAEEWLAIGHHQMGTADRLHHEIKTALVAHDDLLQYMLRLRGELVDLENKIEQFRERYFELRGAYRTLKPSTKDSVVVSLENRTACKTSFGPFRGASTFGVYVQTLDGIVVAGFEAVKTVDIEGMSRALRTADAWTRAIEALLARLEVAVSPHIEAQEASKRHGDVATGPRVPMLTTLAPIIPHPDLGRRFLPAFTTMTLGGKHTTEAQKTKLDTRFLFNSLYEVQKGFIVLAKPKITAQYVPTEPIPLALALEQPANLYQNRLNTTPVDTFAEEHNGPVLHHPRPTSLSPKKAVERWIAELPETVDYFEVE